MTRKRTMERGTEEHETTDEEDEITDRKVIAASYLRGWFFVDVMAIFPFDLIATSIYQQSLAICSKCSFEEENHS